MEDAEEVAPVSDRDLGDQFDALKEQWKSLEIGNLALLYSSGGGAHDNKPMPAYHVGPAAQPSRLQRFTRTMAGICRGIRRRLAL